VRTAVAVRTPDLKEVLVDLPAESHGSMSRRVLLTGARRGIGAACAVGLADGRTTLVLHHLAAHGEIADVARRCREQGAEVEILEADLRDPLAVVELARRAGQVDVIVNNAARASNVELADLVDPEWRDTFAVNVDAPMILARELTAGMAARGWGRIVNVTSATVRMGGPSGAAYVSSKAALVGLTRSLGRSLGASGITVNALSPGAVRTENEAELTAGSAVAEVDAQVLAKQALPRRLVPEDMVGCLRCLVSPDSAAMTGQVLEVGGGIVYR
jgi:NAD(P)-dependent dehydrogenase (short-subunit alcohol dehydrogenase family)